MKILIKIFITCLTFFVLEKLIRTQTEGFRIEKTQSDFPFCKQWEVENKNPASDLFDQSFYFLGSGVQCYVFLGADQKTVLKIFKHYHMSRTINR